MWHSLRVLRVCPSACSRCASRPKAEAASGASAAFTVNASGNTTSTARSCWITASAGYPDAAGCAALPAAAATLSRYLVLSWLGALLHAGQLLLHGSNHNHWALTPIPTCWPRQTLALPAAAASASAQGHPCPAAVPQLQPSITLHSPGKDAQRMQLK